jgi:hypothetical protein
MSGPGGSVDEGIQRSRALEYGVCTTALTSDRVTHGAEGVFDQALTNGLAAIVAYAWPGAELSGTRVRSAAQLLDVIGRHGKAHEDGTVRVLHDPKGPEYEPPSPLFPDDPWPNFTSVNEPVLRDALDVTQAIRHARVDGRVSDMALTDEHRAALADLGFHPALRPIIDELADVLDDATRANARARDGAERERAGAYHRQLDADETARREAIDYRGQHDWETSDGDRSVVEECRVCENWALVARGFDSFTEEVGIGTCHVCSYHRTAEIANEYGFEIDLERAIERASAD